MFIVTLTVKVNKINVFEFEFLFGFCMNRELSILLPRTL